MLQWQLAERIGIGSSVLSKMLSGSSLTRTREAFRRLRDIEDVFDLERGTLLRLLEYVGEQGATQEAILHDGSLPLEVKEALVVVVDHFSGAGATVTDIESRRDRRQPAAETGEPPAVSDERHQQLAEHVAERTRPAKAAKAGKTRSATKAGKAGKGAKAGKAAKKASKRGTPPKR